MNSCSVLSKVSMDDLHVKPKEPKNTFHAVLLDDANILMNIIEGIDEDAVVAFDTETNSLDTQRAKIIGFSFCVEGENAYYVPINHHYLGVGDQIEMDVARKAFAKTLHLQACRTKSQVRFSGG